MLLRKIEAFLLSIMQLPTSIGIGSKKRSTFRLLLFMRTNKSFGKRIVELRIFEPKLIHNSYSERRIMLFRLSRAPKHLPFCQLPQSRSVGDVDMKNEKQVMLLSHNCAT